MSSHEGQQRERTLGTGSVATRQRPGSPPGAARSLAVLLVGAFMALLDTTIVNVALPSVQDGLGASSSQLEWIISGYLLALGLALIPAGRIGDRIGHHKLYVAGLACFTLASLACGLASSPGQLIAARVVQGLGAGVFFPAIAALIQLLYAGPAAARRSARSAR
jgi:MFS family permease